MSHDTNSNEFRRKWAIAYLTARYHEQRLESFFPVETYISANLRYVLRNIKLGFCKRWNREVEGRLI